MSRREKKNNSWENLSGFLYAHRGFFEEPRSVSGKLAGLQKEPVWREDLQNWRKQGKRVIPENSMAAFRRAAAHGCGIELDVHMLSDGTLAVIHDSSLFRVTGLKREVEDLTVQDLSSIYLLETRQTIPLLSQVLDLYTSPQALSDRLDIRCKAPEEGSGPAEREGGQSARLLHLPMIIELKAEHNVRQLCEGVMELIDRYPSLNYCIESFDPRVVFWFRKHRPDVIRGQLTENFMKSREAVHRWGRLLTFWMWSVAPDLLSRPDFIASKFADRKNPFIRLSHKLGVKQVNWTIKNEDDLETVNREGGLSIFERFMPKILQTQEQEKG